MTTEQAAEMIELLQSIWGTLACICVQLIAIAIFVGNMDRR